MADATKTVSIIFEGDTNSAEASVGRLNTALGRVIEEEKRLAEASSAGAAQIDKLGQEADQSAQQMDRLEESTIKTKDAAGLMTAAFQAFIASAVTKAFIDTNIAAEQFGLTMTAVTGSTDLANKEFEYIREVANRMGLEIQSAAASYARLAASTKNTALEGDGARVIFEAFAGSMARLGLSSTEVDAALVQVTQGISKGRFELEDLKSIAERIPGFFDQFARSLGVSTDELFKLIRQGEVGTPELLKFANALNDTLGTATFDTFTANLNRLRNAISETFVILGDAGAWDIFINGLQVGTASIVGATGSMRLLYDLAKILVDQTTSLSLFSAETGEKMQAAFDKAANSMRPASDALLGISDNAKKVGFDAAAAGKQIEESMTAAGSAAGQSAEQILNSFDATMKTASSADALAAATTDLIIAYTSGKITAEQFYTRLDDIQKKQLEFDKATGGATTALLEQERQLSKTSKEAKDATDTAAKYEVELEKIASNERIKLIEAKFKLDIAEVEANAKIAQAALASIGETVKSTGSTLVGLFDILQAGTKDWATWRLITEEIDKESRRRDAALAKQNEYLDALINVQKARAEALQRGDSIIKVDGAGLQPHLEAFMWEILRTIQVRVNADGLEMLVGV